MRVYRIGLAVFVCLGALVARPAPPDGGGQSAVSLYIEGRFLADDGKHDEAIKIMDKAIALDPAFVKALVTRGYCKIHKTPPDLPGALADLTKAVALEPGSAEARILRGEVLFRQRSYKAALADFEKGAEIDPSYPGVFYNRGLARFQLGDNAGALADLDKHLADQPEDAWGYIGRADVRRVMGQSAAELADLNKAVQADPKNARARADREALLAKQEKPSEATKAIEPAAIPPKATPEGIAQDLLSTFSKRLAYLDLKDPSDPSLYRAIFEAFDGEFLEVELIWDAASRSFDVSGMTAISHGKSAAAVQRVIQGYKKG